MRFALGGLRGRRALVFISAMGLTGAVAMTSTAQARELWCPPENVSFNVSQGRAYPTLAGPRTIVQQTWRTGVVETDIIWRGNLQRCPRVKCELRVDHAESKSFSRTKGFSVNVAPAGGPVVPIPFLNGGINYSVTNTTTTQFDVANSISAPPWTTWEPQLRVEYHRVIGQLVGQYRYAGPTSTCRAMYVLDPTARFGSASVLVASSPISTWVEYAGRRPGGR